MITAIGAVAGFLLDSIFGDPKTLLPVHPVVRMGRYITWFEQKWNKDTSSEKMQLIKGVILSISLCFLSYILPFLFVFLSGKKHPILRLLLESYLFYRIFAARSLEKESMKVYDALLKGDIAKARIKLSYIVGRDTAHLEEEEIIKACIETVAENTCDGVSAPIFYSLIGGAPLGYCYKAINTLDSMVGYRNEKYEYFGKFSARLDDVCNYIPAYISGYIMILAAFLLKLDGQGAWKIYKRDRNKHQSPNSGKTESVCAGALQIQISGASSYQGILIEKPVIGDANKTITFNHILEANRLMYLSGWITLFIFFTLRCFLFFWIS